MTYHSRTAAVVSALLIIALAAPAIAGENRSHRDRHHDNSRSGGTYSDYSSHIPGLGTYSGSVSAVRVRGLGNYFYLDGRPGSSDVKFVDETHAAHSGPKIIHVSTTHDGCHYQAGVCIIKP